MTTGGRILIVEARFYPDIADKLAQGALGVLESAGLSFDRVEVPGALEIPAAVACAAEENLADGFVALGCVIRGETDHYEIVARESARGLMDLTLRHGLALGNGILTVNTRDQALARAQGDDGGKGAQAARACLAMMSVRAGLKAGR